MAISTLGVPSQLNLVGSIARLLGAEQRLERRCCSAQANGRPSVRRDVVEVIGRRDAAGARHVAHHHGRIAGNVLADMAGDRARQRVVAAARLVETISVTVLPP